MAVATERYKQWAPRMVTDLMKDFDLKDFQAAGFTGNGGQESGGFESMQEKNPTVAGSRGGLGGFQWTGDRRVAFETWLKRKGWTAHQYDANYSFVYRELLGPEKRTLPALRATKTIEEATEVVMKVYERPGIPHLPDRIAWAKLALQLHKDTPVPIIPPVNPGAKLGFDDIFKELEEKTLMDSTFRIINQEQITTAIRQLLLVVSSGLIVKGYGNTDLWASIIPPLAVLIATVLWGWWARTDKNLIKSAAAVPAVEIIAAPGTDVAANSNYPKVVDNVRMTANYRF